MPSTDLGQLNYPVIVIPKDGYLPGNTSPVQWPSTLDLNCTRSHSLPAPPARFNPGRASSGPGAVLSQADFKIVGTEKAFPVIGFRYFSLSFQSAFQLSLTLLVRYRSRIRI